MAPPAWSVDLSENLQQPMVFTSWFTIKYWRCSHPTVGPKMGGRCCRWFSVNHARPQILVTELPKWMYPEFNWISHFFWPDISHSKSMLIKHAGRSKQFVERPQRFWSPNLSSQTLSWPLPGLLTWMHGEPWRPWFEHKASIFSSYTYIQAHAPMYIIGIP